MPLNEVHISSLVVHVLPEHLQKIKSQINQFSNAEIYADSPEGKIIVVLETAHQGFITDTIDAINQLPNVLSTVLVYHQIETEQYMQETNHTGNTHTQVEGDV